jgi:hypothetical protein
LTQPLFGHQIGESGVAGQLEQEGLAGFTRPGESDLVFADLRRFRIGRRRLQDDALRIAPRAAVTSAR